MLWVLAVMLSGPQLPSHVELFAGERHTFVAPCFGAEVSSAETKLTAKVEGVRVQLSATVPLKATVRVRCADGERNVDVTVKPLPDLFDGEAPGSLPGAPSELTLRPGERRAFNPSCEVSGLHGQGNAADAELSLIRVLMIEAKATGESVLELSCSDGKRKRVDVTVVP